jgi:transglutaminase-like putative cysteine protease
VFSKKAKTKKSADRSEEPQGQRSLKAGLVSRLGGWREWFSFILLFVALEIVVLSLEQAHWITPQPSLTLVLILAMLAVRLLTITRLPGLVIHILALAIGALVTFWQVQGMLSYRQTIYFVVFLTFLTWVMGYVSTWFLLRKKNAWVGVVLGTLIILVNLSNLPGGYYWYFGLFFAAAAILIVQTRLVRGHSSSEPGTRHTGRGLLYFVSALLVVVILAAAVAWVTPEVRIPQLQTMIATKILWKNDFENSRFNIFANVPSKQSINTNNMRLKLPFEASWHLGDRIDFVVNADRPSYWQVRAYDIYTAQGWENSPVTDFDLKAKTPWTDTAPPAKSETVTYTVTPSILTDVLLITGSFISTNKPVQVQVGAGDIIGVLSSHVLSAGESYTVTAAVALATPVELGRAGENYPQSILDNYLQLPADFPESVRQLSANITANATTPYQKVLKINEYLSEIPYKTNITALPQGTDGVAYFLFTQKSGFCVHFASAMAVMLRSVGVPTRLAIGYLPGEPGDEKDEYILRDRYYHAWPQVYFPEYGWIDIEATPSSSEGAGSPVTLTEPWVSSSTIQELPQWDVWARAMYGAVPGTYGGAAAAVSSAEPPRTLPGPWNFADKLGKSLLIIICIVVLAAFLLVLWFYMRSSFYRWIWRVDRSELASATYNKLCQLGAMIKISPRPQQTPLEYITILAAEFPEQADELQEITRAYLERQFGRREGKLDLFNEARFLKARRSLFDKLMSRMTQVEKVFRGRL